EANNASSTINSAIPVAYQERILLFLAWDNITTGKICTGKGINMAMDINVHVNCRSSQRFGFFVANPMLQFTYFFGKPYRTLRWKIRAKPISFNTFRFHKPHAANKKKACSVCRLPKYSDRKTILTKVFYTDNAPLNCP